MSSPARRVAQRVLLRVFEDGAYADITFAAAAAGLEDRERAFAQQLAYGTIQRARTLDHAIEALAGRAVNGVDPPVRAALRLGAYQVAYLDGVPARAAVNESVELVREARLEKAVGFANAVLRRVAEGGRSLVERLPERTAGEAALKHSYPDWVAELWWREHGKEEALDLMRALNEPPETVVRLNRRKPESARLEGTPDPVLPDALRVERVDEAAIEQGLAWPQSRGSQLAGLAVGACEGERTLDLCAAPGGKATQLAGEVVAVEKHPGRARQLEANCARLGATNVTVVCSDALDLPAELTGFDHVLVDAPCSGLGVLNSRADLRWRARPLPELQADLLRVASERVRSGGTVLYSVCTINSEENEAIVDASELTPDRLGDEWPQYRHPRRREFLLTLPHRDRTSGFFVARLWA